jgi:RNA polymerase sigma-70 factor (ECF subfamily)
VPRHPLLIVLREITIDQPGHLATGGSAGTVARHGPWSHAGFDAMTHENGAANIAPDPASSRGHFDTDDFAPFIAVHEHRVAALIGRMLDDPQDVEEATQDTFVQAWRHREDFRGDAAVTTWLYRIATNVALMRMRRRRHPYVPLDDAPSIGANHHTDLTADASLRRARIATIRIALSTLPPELRAAVVLRDIEGLGTAEAADVLGLTEATLKSRLHRGRMRLRTLLADEMGEAAGSRRSGPVPTVEGDGHGPSRR